MRPPYLRVIPFLPSTAVLMGDRQESKESLWLNLWSPFVSQAVNWLLSEKVTRC